MQSTGGEGIASAIEKRVEKENEARMRNDHVVLLHTFGSTHDLRIED